MNNILDCYLFDTPNKFYNILLEMLNKWGIKEFQVNFCGSSVSLSLICAVNRISSVLFVLQSADKTVRSHKISEAPKKLYTSYFHDYLL